jgi:hypothetical protein
MNANQPPATILTISRRSPDWSWRWENSEGATASPLCSTTTLRGGRFWEMRNWSSEQGRLHSMRRSLATMKGILESLKRRKSHRWKSGTVCHSCSMLRMRRAQSNETLPFGNFDSSAKKLEWTYSTSSGSTCQVLVLSRMPSRRFWSRVAE